MSESIPDYIERRIRQHPPLMTPVIPGSTPVIAFGDVRKAWVATLSWNPSKLEFLGKDDRELIGSQRRLETLDSLGEMDLAGASDDSVRQVFQACNGYFRRRPYRWFNALEKVLTHVRASYYDGSARHLDLVQWATNPVWRDLTRTQQNELLESDVPFLQRQLTHENIRVLLLNGKGIVSAYEGLLDGRVTESSVTDHPRLRLFTGRDPRGLLAIGWNINLQSTPGVSNKQIEAIGIAIRDWLSAEDGLVSARRQ